MSAVVRRGFLLVLVAGAVGASLALPALFESSRGSTRSALPVATDPTVTRLFVSLPAPKPAEESPRRGVAVAPAVSRPAVRPAAPVVRPRVQPVAAVPVAVVTPAPPPVAPVAAPDPAPAPAPSPPVSAAPIAQTSNKVIASTPALPVPAETMTGDDAEHAGTHGRGNRNDHQDGDPAKQGGASKHDNGHGKGR